MPLDGMKQMHGGEDAVEVATYVFGGEGKNQCGF